MAVTIWLIWSRAVVFLVLIWPLCRAGSRSEARIAIIAMTTSNSTNVKPAFQRTIREVFIDAFPGREERLMVTPEHSPGIQLRKGDSGGRFCDAAGAVHGCDQVENVTLRAPGDVLFQLRPAEEATSVP